MNAVRSSEADLLSLSQQQRVDEVSSKFEGDWQEGKRPAIEEYLQDVPGPEQRALLGELVAVELELRRAAGEQPLLEEYLLRFPSYAALIEERFAGNVDCQAVPPTDLRPQTGSTVDLQREPPPDLSALASEYIIHELLGQGAMGWVYRASRRHFDMQVALKVVSPSYPRDRFKREAECIVKVRSPHVVIVHDYKVLSDGTPALVMEWIEGSDLERIRKAQGGYLQEHVALPWMKQTCEGMLAVAENGITHRDLKPSNILVDIRGSAKVTDFGLARDPTHSELSRTGQIMGTAYYMSPEQADDPRHVDTRSDVYSFGACFYHLLTGVPPFEGDTAFSVLFKHKMEPLVSPKARNPEISEATSRLLERCLAKSPHERFQSFAEVLRHFELTPWDQPQDKALAKYVSTYQSRRADYLLRRRGTSNPDVYIFPEGRTLKVLVGDLVEQDVEAVVSSDDWLLSMSSGVSRAILLAAGREILSELQCAPVRPGRTVVTSAGKLRAKRIFHAVVTGRAQDGNYQLSRDVIAEAMQSCFYQAESFFVRSIAFPLLGTGAGRFSEEACLDTMFLCLARNLLSSTTAIREARIILYPHSDVQTSSHQTASRPVVAGYRFWDHFQQAGEAVGDFFDYLRLPDNRIAIIMTDVAGHGIPAAVAAREIYSLTQAYLSDGSPEAALARFNEHACRPENSRFVTMLLAILDPSSHQLTILNAGHVPPLWRRADGHVELLGVCQSGWPLGIQPEQRYEPFVLTVSPGESITLVTDGVTSAMGLDGAMYGINRLCQRVAGAPDVDRIVPGVIDDVLGFVAGPPSDALCVVCFSRS